MPIRHPTLTVPALQPQYVSRFRCIGPQCEDNCCKEWHVGLDKQTFEAYQRPEAGKLATIIRINPEPRSDLNYGRIELSGADSACPALENELCSVHRDLGDQALSHTCFTYPRVWTDVGGQAEQSLELSCPEAARLALLAPDAFEFTEGSMTVRAPLVRVVNAREGMSLEAVNEIRYFCLNLMRVDGLPVWQRLAVLGLVCEGLVEPLARRDLEAARTLLADTAALLENGALLEPLAQLQPDHEAQAMLFSVLLESVPKERHANLRHRVADAVASGLGADPLTGQVSAERLVECYRRGLARLPEALQAAPHLLDHYLLNELFLHLFPFDMASPFDSYLRLVSRFGLLRLMLAARCNTEGELPDAATLVQTVQAHYRRFNHDQTLLGRIDAALHKGGWARLDKLYGLLRS
ncbi:hypothetical protein B0920_19235 [Massilia sp. KIM]|uniref:flagellin lysine-N-methylase n=1 Tax=Massilia sp. KIM TaxID=1955422 RepID=UPI00098ECA89|nr:flagellin lysine-N-methylase [Massilia sp. KIM]OON61063.1 hypothetical protein B0920_19235 [Massilia sp. KIM]